MLCNLYYYWFFYFFFNDTATTEIYTLSLHDALPIFYFRLVLPEGRRGNSVYLSEDLLKGFKSSDAPAGSEGDVGAEWVSVERRAIIGMSQPDATASSTGECAVCHRTDIKVIKSTGLLRKHGPHDNPCAGHTQPPARIFFRSSISSYAASGILAGWSADLFGSSSVDVIPGPPVRQTLVSHPISSAPILKHIPKGARAEASNALRGLIQGVTRVPDDTMPWIRLFSFAPEYLFRPNRGGEKQKPYGGHQKSHWGLFCLGEDFGCNQPPPPHPIN